MHYSKSLGLSQPGVTPDDGELTNSQRARRRSSLDTFVIPGRTRIPSNKNSRASEINGTDYLIAQRLFRQSLMPSPNKQSPCVVEPQYQRGETHIRDEDLPSTITQPPNKQPLVPIAIPYQGRGIHPYEEAKSSLQRKTIVRKNSPSKIRPHLMMQPPPKYGSQTFLLAPQEKYHSQASQRKGHPEEPVATQGRTALQTFDGSNEFFDYKHPSSRETSTTWSTMSHRVFTDSSGSSRRSDASHCLTRYNMLAKRYGLRSIPETMTDESTENRTTSKTHHGWLARKLFRKTSSTYTLKAKTTYKPLPRKKSLGGIPTPSNSGLSTIITGKSLEELGRLGGLRNFQLPEDFATDKLTLPTSLSAIATYLLQHGRNAPGLFRVSGQTTTVNALYDFYDQQFSDAGSPSKVERTVGSGLLPTHIEHTLPDVASLFKKILIGLPGGLLGSVELFEALEDILLKLNHDPDLTVSSHATLKAKLVALAISSANSHYRVYLIEAVLGLCAYFAFETEKCHAEQHDSRNGIGSTTKSELMGYQSLGVVFGPLLIGDLIDKIDLTSDSESQDSVTRQSSETRKSKKRKTHTVQDKLVKDATLTAHVDRANLTASVMQQLLIVWRDVVKQLKHLGGIHISALNQSRSTSQIKEIPTRNTSKLSLSSEEEENTFFDILRGHRLPEEFNGPVRVECETKCSSTSPMLQEVAKSPGNDRTYDEWQPRNSQQQDGRVAHDIDVDVPLAVVEDRNSNTKAIAPIESSIISSDIVDATHTIYRTRSDMGMEQMSMGTILQPFQDQSPSPASVKRLRLRLVPSMDDSQWAEKHLDSQSSFLETPTTAVKISRTPQYNQALDSQRQRPTIDMEKPLPCIGRTHEADYPSFITAEPTSTELQGHISSRPASRQSINVYLRRHTPSQSGSLGLHRRPGSRSSHSRERSRPREILYPPRQDSLAARASMHLSPTKEKSRKSSSGSPGRLQASGIVKGSARKRQTIHVDNEHLFGDPKRNSVKLIARHFDSQHFNEESKINGKEIEPDAERLDEMPKVYAYVKPLPSSFGQLLPDPFEGPACSTPSEESQSAKSSVSMEESLPPPILPEVPLSDRIRSSRSPSPKKESMIPKPLLTISHGRVANSESPSPKKQNLPAGTTRAIPRLLGRRKSIGDGVPSQLSENAQQSTVDPFKCTATPQQEVKGEENLAIRTRLPPTLSSTDRSSGTLNRTLASEEQEASAIRYLHNRTLSSARSVSFMARPDSPIPSTRLNLGQLDVGTSAADRNSFLNASEDLKKLSRHGSINSTLFMEILRLQKQLEIKGEEVLMAKRGIGPQRVFSGRGGERARVNTEEDLAKGDDTETLWKQEIELWKDRAERAERELAKRSPRKNTISVPKLEPDTLNFPANEMIWNATKGAGQNLRRSSSVSICTSLSDQRFDNGSRPQTPRKVSDAKQRGMGTNSGSSQKVRYRASSTGLGEQASDIGSEFLVRRSRLRYPRKLSDNAQKTMSEASGSPRKVRPRASSAILDMQGSKNGITNQAQRGPAPQKIIFKSSDAEVQIKT